jgi:hypothetical protein
MCLTSFSVLVLTKSKVIVAVIGILSVLGFVFGTYAGIYSGILHEYVAWLFWLIIRGFIPFQGCEIWALMLLAGWCSRPVLICLLHVSRSSSLCYCFLNVYFF